MHTFIIILEATGKHIISISKNCAHTSKYITIWSKDHREKRKWINSYIIYMYTRWGSFGNINPFLYLEYYIVLHTLSFSFIYVYHVKNFFYARVIANHLILFWLLKFFSHFYLIIFNQHFIHLLLLFSKFFFIPISIFFMVSRRPCRSLF